MGPAGDAPHPPRGPQLPHRPRSGFRERGRDGGGRKGAGVAIAGAVHSRGPATGHAGVGPGPGGQLDTELGVRVWLECEFDWLVCCRDGRIHTTGVAGRGAPARQRGFRVHGGRLAARRGATGLPPARGAAPVPGRPGHSGQVPLEGVRGGCAAGIPHGQDGARGRAAAACDRHGAGRLPQGGRPAGRHRRGRRPGRARAARRGIHAEDEPAADGARTAERGTGDDGAGGRTEAGRRTGPEAAGQGSARAKAGQKAAAPRAAKAKTAETAEQKAGGAKAGARRNSAGRGRSDLART